MIATGIGLDGTQVTVTLHQRGLYRYAPYHAWQRGTVIRFLKGSKHDNPQGEVRPVGGGLSQIIIIQPSTIADDLAHVEKKRATS